MHGNAVPEQGIAAPSPPECMGNLFKPLYPYMEFVNYTEVWNSLPAFRNFEGCRQRSRSLWYYLPYVPALKGTAFVKANKADRCCHPCFFIDCFSPS